MLEPTARLALGPVLLLQGRRVRRTALRLPEAAGPRQGVAGRGPTLRLLVTGDSSAAGVGVATQAQALAGRLAHHLGARREVHWRVVARTGVDAAELLALLADEPAAPHDVAVLCTGVNDVTGGTAVRAYARRLDALHDHLAARWGVRQVVVSPVPPMGEFPALPQPLRWYLGLRATALDRALRAWAAADARRRLVEPRIARGPGAVAEDGYHPSASTYDGWAAAVAAAVAP